jgi:hypothetical protein
MGRVGLRVASLSGVLFVALTVTVAYALTPLIPRFAESGTEIIQFFDENRGDLRAASFVQLVALVFFFIFLAGLSTRFTQRRADPVLALSTTLSGVALGVILLVDSLLRVALTATTTADAGSSARVLWLLSLANNGVFALLVAAFVGLASSVVQVTWPDRAWIAWFGYVVAGTAFVASLSILTRRQGLELDGFFIFLASQLFLLWVLFVTLGVVWSPKLAQPGGGGLEEDR